MSKAEQRDRIIQILYDQGWVCEFHEPDFKCQDCQRLWRETAERIIEEQETP